MRHRLDLALFKRESRLEKLLAVARRAASDYFSALGKPCKHLFKRRYRGIDRLSLIARVIREQKLTVLSYKRKLRRGRSCIYTEIAVTDVALKLTLREHRPRVSLLEYLKRFFVREKRLKSGHLKCNSAIKRELLAKGVDLYRALLARFKRRAHCRKEMRLLGVNYLIGRELQSPYKSLFKLGQEV